MKVLILTNKEAHIINGNISIDKVSKYKTCTISEQSQQGTNDRSHFMNYCLTHPGKFSCAVDSFLELSFVIFKDAVKDINVMSFFKFYFN